MKMANQNCTHFEPSTSITIKLMLKKAVLENYTTSKGKNKHYLFSRKSSLEDYPVSVAVKF